MTDGTFRQEMYKMNMEHLTMIELREVIKDHCGCVRRTQETTFKGLLQAKDGHLCLKRIMTPMD